MGTDIHVVFQAKQDGQWVDVKSEYQENRHYFLFAWLGDVRNGHGFAGIKTHTPIKPIAPHRGLPDDFLMQEDDHPSPSLEVLGRRAEYLREGEAPHVWMGDHSHSYVSADEILSSPCPTKAWVTGIVPIDFFNSWDGFTSPETWSGGISGASIVCADSPVDVRDETTHVRIFWKGGNGDLDYFVDEIRRLKELHGEVRMVFGFDS